MLTQREAEELIAMKKIINQNNQVVLIESFDQTVPLISENKQEHFLLDLKQGRIDLKRIRYQTRYNEIICLVRFDSTGVHENPDGTKVIGPHVHVYREGYGDKFAVAANDFSSPFDVLKSLTDFCKFCNIDNTKFALQLGVNSWKENNDEKYN